MGEKEAGGAKVSKSRFAAEERRVLAGFAVLGRSVTILEECKIELYLVLNAQQLVYMHFS